MKLLVAIFFGFMGLVLSWILFALWAASSAWDTGAPLGTGTIIVGLILIAACFTPSVKLFLSWRRKRRKKQQ